MSGDGSSRKTTSTAKTTPAEATMGTTTFDLMPGQVGLLAEQLAAGGYGNAPGLLAHLNSYYKPMTVASVIPAAQAAAAPATGGAGTTQVASPSNPTAWSGAGVPQWGANYGSYMTGGTYEGRDR